MLGKKHPFFNLDTSYSSIKNGGHASLKYEVALALFHDQIVWINGPFKATRHDITIFRYNGLKQKILSQYPDKYITVDLGYETSWPDEEMLSFPSSRDPLPLKKFKSMCRCRQEDINSRFSKFMCMNREFTHSVAKHKDCHTSVAVIIQYQLNCGDFFLTKL